MLLGAFQPPSPHWPIRNPFISIPAIVPTGWQNANRLAARHFMTFTDPVDDPLLLNRKFKRIIIQR